MQNYLRRNKPMLTFAWPFAFLLLPVLWLFQHYFPKKQHNEAMLRVPFLSRAQKLNQHTTYSQLFSFYFKQIFKISAWSLLVVACANPQWLGEPLPIKQDGRNIMLAIDL